MKKLVCWLAVSGFAAVAMPAMAQTGSAAQRGDFAERMFNRMDVNGDGIVTRKEFTDYSNKRFDELDTNHDGKITREEMAAARDKARKKIGELFNQRFAAADANHDGALSRDEAQQMPGIARHFGEIDANHDGKVTRDEIRDYIAKIHGSGSGAQPR